MDKKKSKKEIKKVTTDNVQTKLVTNKVEYKRTMSETKSVQYTTVTSEFRKISLPVQSISRTSYSTSTHQQSAQFQSLFETNKLPSTTKQLAIDFKSPFPTSTTGYRSPHTSISRASHQDRLIYPIKDATPMYKPVYTYPKSTLEVKKPVYISTKPASQVNRPLQVLPKQMPALMPSTVTKKPEPVQRTTINSDEYSINAKHQGLVLIFEQQSFKDMNMYRKGSEYDSKRLKTALAKLQFRSSDVYLYNNLNYYDITEKIKIWSNSSFQSYNCLMVFFMSHGDKNNIVWARDTTFCIDELYKPFLKQPTLTGKPKMFFIQACRGDTTDVGSKPVLQDSRPVRLLQLPTFADLLIVQSTVEGYYSYRIADEGSWFIQALCDELEKSQKPNATRAHIMDILTAVNRSVAYFKKGHGNEKQCPTITSHLTKKFFFR